MKTKEQFKVGKNNITYVGNNFQKWFYETSFIKSTKELDFKVLPRYMNDTEILYEFKPKESTLGDAFKMLSS